MPGGRLTIGLDLGDKTSRHCVLNGEGDGGAVCGAVTCAGGRDAFAGVSRLLVQFGHEVIVANARQVQLIGASSRRSDGVDAETLARVDPQLLRPVQHRSAEAQKHLAVLRVRAALLEMRG